VSTALINKSKYFTTVRPSQNKDQKTRRKETESTLYNYIHRSSTSEGNCMSTPTKHVKVDEGLQPCESERRTTTY